MFFDYKKINWHIAFSLAEMMIVMLILSIVLAAAAPIITRRVIANENAEKVDNTPAGIINSYAGTRVPDGWLLCNGQSISRIGIYADLYSAIGTTFGVGDGSTTFNVPDLRGEFIRGWDNSRGVDSGRIFGSFQWDAGRNITGQIHSEADFSSSSAFGAFKAVMDGDDGGFWGSGNTGAPQLLTIDASLSWGASHTSTEFRPTNIALNYIIKY